MKLKMDMNDEEKLDYEQFIEVLGKHGVEIARSGAASLIDKNAVLKMIQTAHDNKLYNHITETIIFLAITELMITLGVIAGLEADDFKTPKKPQNLVLFARVSWAVACAIGSEFFKTFKEKKAN